MYLKKKRFVKNIPSHPIKHPSRKKNINITFFVVHISFFLFFVYYMYFNELCVFLKLSVFILDLQQVIQSSPEHRSLQNASTIHKHTPYPTLQEYFLSMKCNKSIPIHILYQ